ncbi:hypothetical protein BDR26DRAFT_1005847 [Obelidium mucronatum]|nr:hypothetical protein BDR26DRAFT_1005847 [Obelidium mucronatum]
MALSFGNPTFAIPILNCVGDLLQVPKGINERCGITLAADKSPVFPSTLADQLKALNCYCDPETVLDVQGLLGKCVDGKDGLVVDTAIELGTVYETLCKDIVAKKECQATLPSAISLVPALLKGIQTGTVESIGAAACAPEPKSAFSAVLQQCGASSIDLNASCPAEVKTTTTTTITTGTTIATTTAAVTATTTDAATTDAAKTTTTSAEAATTTTAAPSYTAVSSTTTYITPATVYSGASSHATVVGLFLAFVALIV